MFRAPASGEAASLSRRSLFHPVAAAPGVSARSGSIGIGHAAGLNGARGLQAGLSRPVRIDGNRGHSRAVKPRVPSAPRCLSHFKCVAIYEGAFEVDAIELCVLRGLGLHRTTLKACAD